MMNALPYLVAGVIGALLGTWITYRIMSGTADRLSAGVLRAQGMTGKPAGTPGAGKRGDVRTPVPTHVPPSQSVQQMHTRTRTGVPSGVTYTPVPRGTGIPSEYEGL